jgi:hypothetical protein
LELAFLRGGLKKASQMATLGERFNEQDQTRKSSAPNFGWIEFPDPGLKGLKTLPTNTAGVRATPVEAVKDKTIATTANGRVEVEAPTKPAVDQVKAQRKTTLDQIMAQPSRSDLTLTELYQQANHGDAKHLYTHPSP